MVHVNLGGYLSLSEAMLLAVGFFYLNLQLGGRLSRSTQVLLGLGALWLASALASDLVAGTPTGDMLKGLARVGILVLCVVSLYRLFRGRPGLYRWFLPGIALSAYVSIYYGQAGYSQADAAGYGELSWDRHFIYPFFYAWLALAAFLWPRRPVLTSLLLFGAGAFSVAMGSRNIGGIMAVGGILSLFLRRYSAGAVRRETSFANAAVVLLVFLVACAGVTALYSKAATLGWLGEKARYKYEMQASGRFGLVLGARPDVMGGLLAVKESPLLGYGSWAKDKQGFFLEAIHILGLDRWGYTNPEYGLTGRIPSHSYLLEAWTEHGLLAIGFWLFSLLLIIRVFSDGLSRAGELLPVLSIQFLVLLWNIFFSPTGSRVATGAVLALLLLCTDDEPLRKVFVGRRKPFHPAARPALSNKGRRPSV